MLWKHKICSSRDIRPSMSNQLYVGMDGFLEELEPVFQVFLRQELSLPLKVKHENRWEALWTNFGTRHRGIILISSLRRNPYHCQHMYWRSPSFLKLRCQLTWHHSNMSKPLDMCGMVYYFSTKFNWLWGQLWSKLPKFQNVVFLGRYAIISLFQGLHLQEEKQQGQRQYWSLHGQPEDGYTHLLRFLQRRWKL